MNTRVSRRSVCGLSIFACLVAFWFPVSRAHALDAPTTFQTPVTVDALDPAAYAVWSDGREAPVTAPIRNALWTQNTQPEWNGLTFGVGNKLGVRALRYGFKTSVPVGCLLVRGNVAVSVLKSGAAYPGRLDRDADWLPGQRLSGQGVTGQGTTRREAGVEDEALWVLPPGTRTRALRFVHTPAPTDTHYAGVLLGAFVFGERFANIAPQAQAKASANDERANRINNESADGTWNAWDNTRREDRKQPPISPTHPESVTLAWRKPVTLRGLCLLGSGFRAGDVAVLSPGADPLRPADADWQTVKTFTGWTSRYPLSLGPNFLVFDHALTARAIRLRMTGTIDESAHPHLGGTTAEGRRVWLGEMMALAPLENAALASALPPLPPAKTPHPPIPVRFTLAAPGFVTLVIEDAQGKRVRNLIANTFYEHAGPNVAWWDGLDDRGRDTDAAHHGVYHVPGQLVPPGDYRVRGLAHPQIDLRYQLSVYDGGGTPPWETADHTGGWTTNHTPPQSVLAVPPMTVAGM